MASIRKRKFKSKKGTVGYSWEISWCVDGKQFKKGGYKSELEAQLDLHNVVLDTSTDIAFLTLANDYLNRHCEMVCKQSTKALYENYLKVSLSNFKKKIAKDITKRDIETLILQLKNKGLTAKTINGIITFVQAVLNYGVDSGFLKDNPIRKIKKLPQVKPPIHFLNETQIQVFLRLAKEYVPTYYAFFFTAIFTGMRRGELMGLEWSDIDFKNSRITVSKQIYKGMRQSTKTGKSRIIDISEPLLVVLKEHKKQNNILTKLVFHQKDGLPIHPYNMEETYFHPLVRKCNEFLDDENQIEKLRFHDLRHTYATYLLSKNIPIKYVQSQLGHSTARMTLDTYASVLPSIKNDAMDILNSLCYKEEKGQDFIKIEQQKNNEI